MPTIRYYRIILKRNLEILFTTEKMTQDRWAEGLLLLCKSSTFFSNSISFREFHQHLFFKPPLLRNKEWNVQPYWVYGKTKSSYYAFRSLVLPDAEYNCPCIFDKLVQEKLPQPRETITQVFSDFCFPLK